MADSSPLFPDTRNLSLDQLFSAQSQGQLPYLTLNTQGYKYSPDDASWSLNGQSLGPTDWNNPSAGYSGYDPRLGERYDTYGTGQDASQLTYARNNGLPLDFSTWTPQQNSAYQSWRDGTFSGDDTSFLGGLKGFAFGGNGVPGLLNNPVTMAAGTVAGIQALTGALGGAAPTTGVTGDAYLPGALQGTGGLAGNVGAGTATAGAAVGDAFLPGALGAGAENASALGLGDAVLGAGAGTAATSLTNVLSQLAPDALKAIVNYVGNSQASSNYQDAANQAINANITTNDPKRAQYQQALSQLVSNPAQFFQTNPLYLAQADLARQAFEANYSKYGMGGTQITDYLRNIMNQGAQTYNQQIQDLSALGGFTFGNSGASNAASNLLNNSAGTGAQSLSGTLATLLSNSTIQNGIKNAANSVFDTVSSWFS